MTDPGVLEEVADIISVESDVLGKRLYDVITTRSLSAVSVISSIMALAETSAMCIATAESNNIMAEELFDSQFRRALERYRNASKSNGAD
jgi:hypothetical protein